jgi:hypothetical protein
VKVCALLSGHTFKQRRCGPSWASTQGFICTSRFFNMVKNKCEFFNNAKDSGKLIFTLFELNFTASVYN